MGANGLERDRVLAWLGHRADHERLDDPRRAGGRLELVLEQFNGRYEPTCSRLHKLANDLVARRFRIADRDCGPERQGRIERNDQLDAVGRTHRQHVARRDPLSSEPAGYLADAGSEFRIRQFTPGAGLDERSFVTAHVGLS
jgi:hypothetical protein